MSDLKPIYKAVTEDEALFALKLFSEKWNGKYPLIAKSWQSNRQHISPILSLSQEIKCAIYTTNVIESLNYSPRKILILMVKTKHLHTNAPGKILASFFADFWSRSAC